MFEDFEILKSQGEALLIQWKEERKQEGVQLEFKRKDGRDRLMTQDDNANLGKCLSGFSNAQGGLVVWGVEAVKGEDGIDCIQQLKPFVEFKAFKASVDGKIGSYLMPRHEDIETLAFASLEDPSRGYVAIKIGPSNLRPHRSEAKDDGRYYRRGPSGTYRMQHYEIIDMLRINTVARLAPKVNLAAHKTQSLIYEAVLRVFLRNDSFVSARFPYLSFKANKLNVSYPKSGFVSRVSEGKKFVVLQGGVDDTIHPGMDRHILDITVQWKAGTNSYCHGTDGHFWSFQGDGFKPMIFTGNCGCENSLGEAFKIEWSKYEIEKLFDKVRAAGEEAYRTRQWERF